MLLVWNDTYRSLINKPLRLIGLWRTLEVVLTALRIQIHRLLLRHVLLDLEIGVRRRRGLRRRTGRRHASQRRSLIGDLIRRLLLLLDVRPTMKFSP